MELEKEVVDGEPKVEPVENEEGNIPTAPVEKEHEVPEEPFEGSWEDELGEKGGESIIKERNRLREKIAKLETERKTPPPTPIKKENQNLETNPSESKDFDAIQWASRTQRGKAAIAEIRRSGLDDLQIKAIIDLIGETSTEITKWGVDPIASEFRESKFTKALKTFSDDDKYKFVMSKPEIRKEVESYIRNNYQPEEWNKPEVIKVAYGMTVSDHPEIFTSGKREIVEDGSIHEKGEGRSVSENSSELSRFAKEYGMDNETKDDKETVRAAYKAYKDSIKK